MLNSDKSDITYQWSIFYETIGFNMLLFSQNTKEIEENVTGKGYKEWELLIPKQKQTKKWKAVAWKGKEAKQCKSIRVEAESAEGKHAERRESSVTLNTTDSKWKKKCDFLILSFLEKNCFKRCDIKIYSKRFEEVARFSQMRDIIAYHCNAVWPQVCE